MKVSFGYSDSDDRLWIRAGGSGPLWWVTRRMALRLVSEWAALLERTMPDADADVDGDADDAAAAGMAGRRAGAQANEVRRAERLRAEHRAAQASPRPPREPDEGEGGRGEAPVPAGAGALVYSVDLGSKDGRIRLVLRSSGQHQAIMAPREDSHRLLAAFVSRCRRNGWLQARLPAWLEAAAADQPGSEGAGPASPG